VHNGCACWVQTMENDADDDLTATEQVDIDKVLASSVSRI